MASTGKADSDHENQLVAHGRERQAKTKETLLNLGFSSA